MNRRNFLKTLGILSSIPYLESAFPKHLWANTQNAPLKMAFVYAPNGKIMKKWTPDKLGNNFQFKPTMAPLAKYKNDFQIISGLAHKMGWANGDGPGDHARANASFLTGCQAYKTDGSNIRLGISVDQVAAKHVGHHTLLPSLELSCDQRRSAGRCDSGYSCAYQYNLSWKSETTPMAPESNPRLAFERLFSSPWGTSSENSLKYKIIDEASKETQRLKHRLGKQDQRKLDEYLSSVDALERRIERMEKMNKDVDPNQSPLDIPSNYEEHIHMMFDIMTLAFQTDATRIITFMLAHDGSNRKFPQVGVNGAHHQLSHHKNNGSMIKDVEKIDLFYTNRLAYFLDKMKSTTVNGRSLLKDSMIVYGSGISDGNRHSHDDLPILLAGEAGGTLNPGRHVRFKKKTPMTNLYMSMLKRIKVNVDSIGDSTGALENL